MKKIELVSWIGCVLLLGLWLGVSPAWAGETDSPERLLYGVGPGNYYPGDLSKDVKFYQLLKDAGVTHITYGFNWDNIEKTRGQYNWEPWDYTVDMACRHGVQVVGIIVGCPEWALPTSGDLGWLPVALNMPREECTPDFQRFVTELGRRYAGRITYWEFWNEPNGFNMAPTVGESDPRYAGKIKTYTAAMKIAYEALKKGNPKAIMATGGLDAGGVTGTWLEGLYANGAKGFMDAVDIHPYTNDPPYVNETFIRKTREIMDKNGDKDLPIFINEYGTYNPTEEVIKTAVNAIKEKYPTVTMLTYLALKDFYGGEGLEPWGLLDINLDPKPSGGYEAFKALPKPLRAQALPVPSGPCWITGSVTDAQLQKPLANCYVLAMPGAFHTQTNKDGIYTIEGLPEGPFRVRAFPPGLAASKPQEVVLAGTVPGKADIAISREVLPLADGETFDPAKDRADSRPDNLIKNGSFDKMQDTEVGQYGEGWGICNTVQKMTYASGAGVGGVGLSQKMGHSGMAVQQGVFQAIPTEKGKKYRLTFWFAYTGQGRVPDLNNSNRFGIDLQGGAWEHPNPAGGRPKYGFPETLQWAPMELATECDKRAGGIGKGEGKWYSFTHEFTAEGTSTSLWFEAAATEGENSRKYYDEICVVAVE